jgi:hypothetical protein
MWSGAMGDDVAICGRADCGAGGGRKRLPLPPDDSPPPLAGAPSLKPREKDGEGVLRRTKEGEGEVLGLGERHAATVLRSVPLSSSKRIV